MPLTRGHQIGHDPGQRCYAFTMFDGTGEIMVLVNDNALHTLCRRAFIESPSRDEVFRLLRVPLEAVANQKFDAGQREVDGKVVVTIDDVK